MVFANVSLILMFFLSLCVFKNDATCRTCGQQPECKNVTTANITFEQMVSMSPLYDQFTTSANMASGRDSVCSTYVKLASGRYLRFIVDGLFDGTYQLQTFIESEIEPGVTSIIGLDDVIYGNSSRVYVKYILGALSAPCNSTFVSYVCPLFSNCSNETNTYTRIAISSSPAMSDQCFQEAISLSNSQQFSNSDVYRYQYKLSKKCVASFNGVPTINAGKIACEDQIAIL